MTGNNISTGPFINKPQNLYNRNTSESVGGGATENHSPVAGSIDFKGTKAKKSDGQGSKTFFSSFFYNQPGGTAAANETTLPVSEGHSLMLDDKKRGTATSAASGSSYNKFKNFLYNTVKTAQVNYHSKISMNLKDKQFFQHVKERDTKTMLLHN